jgi:hypothetical protein
VAAIKNTKSVAAKLAKQAPLKQKTFKIKNSGRNRYYSAAIFLLQNRFIA